MAYPRVLHLIGSLEPGGTERQLVGFIQRASNPDQHLVAVFTLRPGLGDALPTPPVILGPMDRRLRGVPSGVRTMRDLRVLVNDVEPDLVHAHLGYSQALAALAVRRDIPIVASRRGRTPRLESFPGREIARLSDRRVTTLIVNSHELAERAASDRWAPPVVVIPNGVDLATFEEAAWPTGPPTVVMVARMRPEKRHDRFLRVFRGVVDRRPDARAILVGDGPTAAEVRGQVSALALESNIELVGARSDPSQYLARAHVVTLTSDHEGLPNALLEGMAVGRPVVAASVGGIPELVDQRCGITVSPHDEPAMTDAFLSLLEHPERASAMGRAARRCAEDYGWDAVVDRTEKVYADVLSRNGAATSPGGLRS